MAINKENNIPLYTQLMDLILDEIESGKLTHGDKIHSERELAEFYSISRATVRQAISELEKQGYLHKIHGKGTFVSNKRMNQELNGFYSFGEVIEKEGKKPSNKVIDLSLREAGVGLGKIFNIDINDTIYVLSRIRLADGEALMYETTYLPTWRFKDLKKMDIEKFGLYNALKNIYSVELSSADETFYPCILDENDEKFLNITPGDCGMILERITYENNSVIEFTKSIVRGDKFKYKVHLKTL
ncbi:MAG: GntR family transcriptional regulator [Cetobacterium sp.]